MIYFTIFLIFGFFAFAASSESQDVGPRLRNHDCKVHKVKVDLDGFVSFTEITWNCKSVTPSFYANATCSKRCRNPVTKDGLALSCYKPEPVKFTQKFRTNDNKTFTERLTISCRCVRVTNKEDKGCVGSRTTEKKSTFSKVGPVY